MSTEPEQTEAPSDDVKKALYMRLLDRIFAVHEWARQTRLRMFLVGSATLVALTTVLAVWSMLARMAVTPTTEYNLEMALAALDEQRYEDARAIIGALQHQASSQTMIGGALFVLGVAKAHEADSEWSAERRRAMHLVAARYLQKARTLGVPRNRETQLVYLLGLSLVKANQAEAGIELLEEALEYEDMPVTAIHRMLVDAHLQTADPHLPKALQHVARVLEDDSVSGEQQGDVLVTQAELLLRTGQLAPTREAVNKLSGMESHRVDFHLLSGRLDLRDAALLPTDSTERTAFLDSAAEHFQQAQANDRADGPGVRQSQYWLAEIVRLKGDSRHATELFDQISKSYGDAPEGVAAQLAEAELELRRGAYDRALIGFRQVLESISDPELFVNPLLSLSELRERMLFAYQQFIIDNQYEFALSLVEQFVPVFNHLHQIQLRGRTHADWARALALKAIDEDDWSSAEIEKESRYHSRAAGRAYEDLARLQFASRTFTDDLMTAAEKYFEGQSYSHAIRLLEEYLEHEARRQNAYALLLLGEAKLARGDPEGAIAALKECIEMYPRDDSVYQARLVRALAHRQLGDYDLAEALLLTNLYRDDLTPSSLQWQESKFALGQLLYAAGRYDQSIVHLYEAVERYPGAEDFLLAKYTIARANQKAAEVHAERLREAKTPNEQQKNRDEMIKYLERAHATFEEVQRVLALKGLGEGNQLHHTLLRNCYMMKGSVLFKLKRYEEARQAFSDIVTFYQGEPYVLEAFVQVANCWRRLNEPVKARATMQSAVLALERLPEDLDFRVSTNFSRQQWELMLNQMKQW